MIPGIVLGIIVGDHYASGLTSHAQKLTFDAVSAYENSSRATRKRAFRRLGGHALDMLLR